MVELSFLKYTDEIKETIRAALGEYEHSLPPSSKKLVPVLIEFTLRGKLMRGSLLAHAARKLGSRDFPQVLKAAASIELLHSGILIIDDIIDRDEKRRGLPSMHILLKGEFLNKRNLEITGEDFAMAAGLTITYIGFSLLDSLPQKILHTLAHAFALTGFAEVEELRISAENEFSKEEVLQIYKLKTGFYSFCAPLKAGAILAERHDLLDLIEETGLLIGIAFQIKDDLIELQYGEEVTGKPTFSDLRAGRKNFPVVALFEMASEEEKEKIKKIFSSGGVKERQDLDFLLELFNKYRIVDFLEKEIKDLSKKALEKAEVDPDFYEVVKEIVDFNLQRKK